MAIRWTTRLMSRSRSPTRASRGVSRARRAISRDASGHRVLPPTQPLQIEQRLRQPAAQQPPAHRGACGVQHPEQRAFDAATAPALEEFQVAAGVGVEGHEAADVVGFERGDLGQGVALGLAQIGDDRARRADRQGQPLAAERFERGDAELLAQPLAGDILAEVARRRRG